MPFHIITPEIQHANAVGGILSDPDVIASPFWRRSNLDLMQAGIGGLDQGRLAGLPGAGEDDQAFS